MFPCVSFFICDDSGLEHNPAGTLMGSCRRTRQRMVTFIYRWRRVYPGMGHGGRGQNQPTFERARL